MALDKNILKASIVTIMTDMLSREETSVEEFAERLSTAIDAYVKAGVVTGVCPTNGGPLTNGKVT